MTCEKTVDQLYEYLDNELDEKSYTKIKQHLNTCNICCGKFEFEQSLKNIIKAKSQIHKIPENVKENIVNQLSARQSVQSIAGPSILKLVGNKIKGIFQFLSLKPAYIALAVLLPLLISGLSVYLVFFKSTDYSSPIIEGITERHEKFVSNKDFLKLSTSDMRELERYFKNPRQIDFASYTPGKSISTTPIGTLPGEQRHPGEHEIKFWGSKNYNLAGRKSVYIGLEKMPAKISFEMIDCSGIKISGLKKDNFRGRPYYFVKRKGYNVVLWKQGNKLYSLTSTINRRELIRVANSALCSFSK